MSERVPPLIAVKDFIEIGRIPFLAILSWTVPERTWDKVARGIARVTQIVQVGQARSRGKRHMRKYGDRIPASSSGSLEIATKAHYYMARMQAFREYWPRGRSPEVDVIGAENIEAALERGNGVVLWVAPFLYSDLVTKIGLHRAGYEVSHLSRPSHGFTPSRFGIHVLNPIWTRIEDRYLTERVRIGDPSLPGSALVALRDRLSENRAVSITVGRRARKIAQVDFLGAKLRLATGPLHLAWTSGAALLPVFSVRTGVGKFVVNIERSLIDPTEDRSGGAYEGIVQEYAGRLERYILDYPGQWNRSWAREE